MMDYVNCEKVNSNKILKFKENRSVMIFKNNNHKNVRQVKVDKCLNITGKRCDYLLICENIEHYVELKGCDVENAVIQIENTIKILSIDPANLSKHSFVISTRCPLITTQIQSLKRKFKEKYCSSLHVKNRELTFELGK
jgi:hypothetical protein